MYLLKGLHNKTEIVKVRRYLRRSFEVFPKLSVSARDTGAEIMKATEDQMGFIETIETFYEKNLSLIQIIY